MYSIDDYIKWAKRKSGINSERKLSTTLGLSLGAVGSWTSRKAFPSDEAMVKLATLAGQDVDLALLYLNWWRAVSRNEHTAADHYLHMIESFDLQAA